MKPLPVDFKERSRPSRWHWLVLIAAGAAALAMWTWAITLERQLTSTRSAADINARAARQPRPEPKPTEPKPYQASAELFLRQAQSAWPQAVTSLESAAMPGVTVKVLEYDSGSRQLRVEVSLEQQSLLPEYLLALHAGEDEKNTKAMWSVQWVRRLEGPLWGASLVRPTAP